ETRRQYVQHVGNMLHLIGESEQDASTDAQKIMALETSLAKVSMTVVERRDPEKLYHKLPVTDLVNLVPTFAWNSYLRDTGTPPVQSLNVTSPDFFKGLETVLKQQDLSTVKIYLKWHLVHAMAPMLPASSVNENFEFYSKKLQG